MGTETGSTGDPPGGGHPQGRVAVPRIAVAAALVVTGGYLTTVVATTVVSRLSLGIAMVSALAIAAFVPGRPFPAWVRAHIVAAAVLVALVSPLNGAAAPIGLACLPLAGLLRAVSQARTFWTLLWLPIVMTFLAGCVAFMLFVLGAFFGVGPPGDRRIVGASGCLGRRERHRLDDCCRAARGERRSLRSRRWRSRVARRPSRQGSAGLTTLAPSRDAVV